MNPDLVKSYAAPAPRYTSYPTAQQFSADITSSHYAEWLAELKAGANLSLYCHIPFCQSLCWYCGCTTKALRRYDPVATYMDAIVTEIANVAALVVPDHHVSHIHWGGGTPNILQPGDIERLSAALRTQFTIAPDAEFAVEIDPRHLDPEQVAAFQRSGVNRVSIGVQDFDPAVQAAINRVQSFEMTQRAIDMFRDSGITSVNVDLVYGLPNQTSDSIARTIAQVLSLRPDRIATFGYAHLPLRLIHQRLIDESVLPGPVERFAQSQILADLLVEAGYVRIGLDHFALPTDHLTGTALKRNFQGYSTEQADALLGFGASAIGQLPQGYVQNTVASGDYISKVGQARLATVRGVALTDDDRARAWVIEQLMCGLSFNAAELRQRFPHEAATILADADAILAAKTGDFFTRKDEGYGVTEAGRPFVRTICTKFDSYFEPVGARHAMAV